MSWSFANGMESGLSILVFGALARIVLALGTEGLLDHLRRLSLIGCLLALACLARLDDIFLLPAFAALLALSSQPGSRALKATAALLALPIGAIAAYLLYNWSYSDTLLPTSGAAKSGLALDNFWRILTLWSARSLASDASWAWRHEVWRVLQLIVPWAASLGFLLRLRPLREVRTRLTSLGPAEQGLAAFALYVVLKGAYNLLFVKLWHQGHWYYPLSIFTFNALVVWWVERRLATSGQPAPALKAEYLRTQDVSRWRFALAYREPKTGLAFIEFWPRAEADRVRE